MIEYETVTNFVIDLETNSCVCVHVCWFHDRVYEDLYLQKGSIIKCKDHLSIHSSKMFNAAPSNCLITKFKRIKKLPIRNEVFLFLKVIYIAVCLSGLLYQTAEITANFFRYEVVSTVKIKLPGEESARAITLCVDFYRSVHVEKLKRFLYTRKAYLENQSDFDGLKRIERIFRTFELPQLSSIEVRLAAQEYFNLGNFLDMTLSYPFCYDHTENSGSNSCSRIHFIIKSDVCYRVVPNETPKVTTEAGVYGASDKPLFAIVTIIREGSFDFSVMLNRVDKFPRYEYIQARKFKFPIDERVFVNAHSYRITRVQAPYEDDCFNYEPTYEDQDDAITKCINELTENITGRLSFMTMFDKTSPDLNRKLQTSTEKAF